MEADWRDAKGMTRDKAEETGEGPEKGAERELWGSEGGEQGRSEARLTTGSGEVEAEGGGGGGDLDHGMNSGGRDANLNGD